MAILQSTTPKILVFSSIGDTMDCYKELSTDPTDKRKGISNNYHCCFTYYGNQMSKFRDIRKHSTYCEKYKGSKFQNLVKIFPTLPPYDYYVVIDDDIIIAPEKIKYMVQYMDTYKYGVGSPSHSANGIISWNVMRSKPNSETRETPFVEMTFVIFNYENMKTMLNAYAPYSDLVSGWGIDFIISAVCKKPFIIFDSIPILNPTMEQKGVHIKEIDKYQSQSKRRAGWKQAIELSNGKFRDMFDDVRQLE